MGKKTIIIITAILAFAILCTLLSLDQQTHLRKTTAIKHNQCKNPGGKNGGERCDTNEDCCHGTCYKRCAQNRCIGGHCGY